MNEKAAFMGKIKDIWKNRKAGKLGKDNFLIMILTGILLLVIVWPTSNSSKGTTNDSKSQIMDNGNDIIASQSQNQSAQEIAAAGDEELAAYTRYLEARLEEVLSIMEGAGQVRVMITLQSSGETVIEKDTPIKRSGVTEVDSEGGSRNSSDIESSQETIYITDSQGNKIPFIKKTIQPVIEGVVVAAQGGENPQIIQNITEAIKALFGVEPHKIKIVKMISE